ncbi:MAG: NAD(P)H-dependent glycerol-3-phosphate dehydrogenase [Slackia sp.]|nr:NAD(P)H-dependent glycerol-3-phosphate dehydrogenase [Slackia sp.]
MKVAVIGAGSWGTALAHVLGTAGHDAMLWARKQEVCDGINEAHRNPRYLVNETVHGRVRAAACYDEVLVDAAAVVVVTPSSVLRQVACDIAPYIAADTPIAICSKGVEARTGKLPVEIFEDELGNRARIAALTGPNHAEEVIRGIASGTVIAAENPDTARFFQELFATEAFRTYVSDDIVGAEVCAAFKNVIAIAVGAAYGFDLGDNTAALIMTRGLAEMSRLVEACGGTPMTCMGLAGVGDLIATCTSEHSRNRTFGYRMAQGTTLEQYKEETHMVVEGAIACQTLGALAEVRGVELPITEMVRAVLWEGADPRAAASALFDRSLKPEFY